jgi:gas vesicle protein
MLGLIIGFIIGAVAMFFGRDWLGEKLDQWID